MVTEVFNTRQSATVNVSTYYAAKKNAKMRRLIVSFETRNSCPVERESVVPWKHATFHSILVSFTHEGQLARSP